MSIARALAKVLRDNFQMHVAWVPVATSFSLGDYGVWRDGVFAPIGNISEFGVVPRIERGRDVNLEFISARSSTTQVAAGVRGPVSPTSDAEAEAQIRFGAEQSFLIKVGKLGSTRIANIAEVARRLDDTQRWSWRYKVVGELFVGEDVLLVATTERDTTVSLRGKARALAGLEGGSIGGGVSVSADRRLGLNITGGAGPVGLGLFRVRLSGAPVLDFSEDLAEPGTFVTHEGLLAEVTTEEQWETAPEDDEPAE